MQKNDLHCLTSYIKRNSKEIKDLNVRPEIIKLLEDLGSKLLDKDLDVTFFNLTPETKQKQK